MNTEERQLALLQLIQSGHATTNQAVYSYLTMTLPIPWSWRFALYDFLNSLPIPTLSPLQVTIIVIFGVFGLIVAVGVFLWILVSILRPLIPLVLSLALKKKPIPKESIQLTFPTDTSKSAYATEQLYALLHTLSRQLSWSDRLAQRKHEYALEIVGTKKEGVRYILSATPHFLEIISRSIRSYLPGVKISPIADYIFLHTKVAAQKEQYLSILEFKLSNHFALPLEIQKTLAQNDPIVYLTGNMTKLQKDELIAYQVIVTPVVPSAHGQALAEMQKLRKRMYQGLPLTPVIRKNVIEKFVQLPGISLIAPAVIAILKVMYYCLYFIVSFVMMVIDETGKSASNFMSQPKVNPQAILNPYETELSQIIKKKIDQQLFEASIRLVVISDESDETQLRMEGLRAAFGQLSSAYQSLVPKESVLPMFDHTWDRLKQRSLSLGTVLNPNPLVSASELSDLYHFPYTALGQSEDMTRVHSKELPAPLSIKNTDEFDVVFGTNTYGNTDTPIGLTDDDRSRHVYMLGQTGSGKSTIIYHMAKDDTQKGRGVAVIDPHGDLAQDLLLCVPDKRLNDCIYLNPFDIRYPIGINLLELSPTEDDNELEQEQELVCESVISIFRRVFNNDENADAHRIEYILRNAIYTAFTVPDATIFTVYELLNNPKFQKTVTKNLTDENLRNFWANEFGKAGNFQVVKMAAGVTSKVGRFLFSPTAYRMLSQSKSTINFDDILATGKILICNLSEGKIGEDTSRLLGTTILAKLQQAAMRRARIDTRKRKPFYIFVDEFQNFATSSFTKLLSGGRKFGLRLTIAEQSTSQQSDQNITNTILANTGTMICFRTASPVDEQLMLSQFAPYLEQGEIGNLPRFRFYLKLSAVEPEEPFSGQTLPIVAVEDTMYLDKVIAASRKNYARKYQKKEALNQAAKEERIVSNKVVRKAKTKKEESLGSLT